MNKKEIIGMWLQLAIMAILVVVVFLNLGVLFHCFWFHPEYTKLQMLRAYSEVYGVIFGGMGIVSLIVFFRSQLTNLILDMWEV